MFAQSILSQLKMMQTLFKKQMDSVLKKCKNMPYLCWLATFTVASTLMHFAFWVLEFGVCAQNLVLEGVGQQHHCVYVLA